MVINPSIPAYTVLSKGLLPDTKKSIILQKELTLLCQLVYGEARNQSYEGMKAVAAVAINRWKNRCKSLRDIILEKYQFSCFNASDPNSRIIMNITTKDFSVWDECCRAAISQYMGLEVDPTGNAIHYLTVYLYNHYRPDWDWNELEKTIIIGDHIFFKRKA